MSRLRSLTSSYSIPCIFYFFLRSLVNSYPDANYKWGLSIKWQSDNRVLSFFRSCHSHCSAQSCAIIQKASLTGCSLVKLTTWWTLNHQTSSCNCHPNVPQSITLHSFPFFSPPFPQLPRSKVNIIGSLKLEFVPFCLGGGGHRQSSFHFQ